MPIIGSFGAGSAGGFGQRKGGKPYFVRYLVIGGGAAGGFSQGGGGGAGGYREIACKTYEVVSGKSYTVSVGAGSTQANTSPADYYNVCRFNGNPSTFDTIVSAGGGAGGSGTGYDPVDGGTNQAQSGGSGGGTGRYQNPDPATPPSPAPFKLGGLGNVPPVSPPQGNQGGSVPVAYGTAHNQIGGGGGGAGAVGNNGSATAPSSGYGGPGGAGTASSITGSSVTRAGGGGGGGFPWPPGYAYPVGSGGSGGGGNAGDYGVTYPTQVAAQPGTANTGGGGGAGPGVGGAPTGSGAGGSGVVIIRRTTACSSGASGGCESTCGADTIHVFNSPGTFTA